MQYAQEHVFLLSEYNVFTYWPVLSQSPFQSIIYYLVHSPKLSTWLKDATIQEALQSYTKWHHIERDPQVFSVKIDEDYVHCLQGVTRASFCNVYLEWIQHCAGKMETVRPFKTVLNIVLRVSVYTLLQLNVVIVMSPNA